MAIARTMLFTMVILLAVALSAQVQSQVIQGSELEEFLREAEIVESDNIPVGITGPRKLTMVRDGTTRYAAFKSIDDYKNVMRFADGRVDANFQDSWMSEIAAYEIDKIIGLGMVPATVERTYKGVKGSAQIWVDAMMTEGEHRRQKIVSPDLVGWNDQMFKVRLFDNIVYNTDRNLGNLLITRDWEIVLIDHSRAFRPLQMLKSPKDLERFSRSMLEGLQRLTLQNLTERAGKYLPKPQIEGILKRRDLVIALATKLAAQKGEGAVYYR
jgi:hypothetical protein